MAEIIKVYRESLPDIRLIGRRYTNADRDEYGSFSSKWGEFFEKGYFNLLEGLGSLPKNEGAYVGLMRCEEQFEYWIGMFFDKNTQVPDGFSYLDIPSADIGTCWIYGKEDNGELYGDEIHNKCISKLADEGWEMAKNQIFFERYNCPRFTTPDEKGNVILDYCIYLEE